MANGRFYVDQECLLDLVARIDEPAPAPNALIAPLEWALAQLDSVCDSDGEPMDPDWQTARDAAQSALDRAKGLADAPLGGAI